VKAATLLAANTSASLPAHMQTWKETIALYRLLDEKDVTVEALMHPQWQQTRQQLETRPLVLLVQDTTEVDLSHHPKTTGLGQGGNERGRGLSLQTVLAVLPENGETRSQRRERETDVWMPQVTRLGTFSDQTSMVHVGDRGADLFPFCRSLPGHADPFSGARV
jgi:hypothetical protein